MDLSKAILSIINNEYQTNPDRNEVAWKLKQKHSNLIKGMSDDEIKAAVSMVYMKADHPYLSFRRKIHNEYFSKWFDNGGGKVNRQDLERIFQDADDKEIDTDRLAEDLFTDFQFRHYHPESNIHAPGVNKRDRLISSNWVTSLPIAQESSRKSPEITTKPAQSREEEIIPRSTDKIEPEKRDTIRNATDKYVPRTNPTDQSGKASSPFKWVSLIFVCITVLIILYYYKTDPPPANEHTSVPDTTSNPVPAPVDGRASTGSIVVEKPVLEAPTTESIPGFQYENASYDIFIIKNNDYLAGNFTIYTNTRHLSEAAYFKSLKASLNQPYFAITASSVGLNCDPKGLLTIKGDRMNSLNVGSGDGNFFLKPNGVITLDQKGSVAIQNTESFTDDGSYKMAIQAGPMLVINGEKHPVFEKSSTNKNIRCGVGIFTKNNETFLVFIKSREPVTFYQLFQIFHEKFNCSNALNLEGSALASIHLPNAALAYRNNLSVCRYLVITLPNK